ncbi:MAG: hypothetical protein PHY12_02055 [Eubacteriales bacterium]|nr:hypothetical protein [Eubacteriales bacterium]
MKHGFLCLLAALALCAGTALAQEDAPVTPDTPVYYNPEGGSYFHLDPECQTIAAAYRGSLAAVAYGEWFEQGLTHAPCAACAVGHELWAGEKELFEAWPALRDALGLTAAARPTAWRVTKDGQTISILLQTEGGETQERRMTLEGGKWTLAE